MESTNCLSGKNLEEICRACLAKRSSLSLFVAIYNEGETFNLCEAFENSTNILVDENDDLPKAVCEDCLNELISVHYFIKKCKSSNHTLRSMFERDYEFKFSDCLNNKKVALNEVITKHDNKQADRCSFSTVCSEPLINDAQFVQHTSDGDQSDLDDMLTSKIETLLRENELSTEQIMPQIITDPKKLHLDSDLLLIDNIEIKHAVSVSVDNKSDYERKRVWREKNKTKFNCNICLKPCPSQTRLTEHLRTHTKEKPYKCDKCVKKFALLTNLKRHMRVHTGEKPYICHLCNKGFTQSTSLRSHMRLHRRDKPYVCRCGKSFHPDTFCPFSLRRYDKDLNAKKAKKSGVCKECGTIYTASCHTSKHTLIDDCRCYLCSICGKEYRTRIGLEHHYRIHTGERPYKCKLCEKAFYNSTALRMHHLTHTGERPCVCKICGKCFIQPAHLRYHMLIHTGVKEFACMYCHKAFALKGNLTQHLRTHTDETPYQCTECDKSFRTASSMKKHQHLHISVKLEKHEPSITQTSFELDY